MTGYNTCPIWGTPAYVRDGFYWDGKEVNSPHAGGYYVMTREAERNFRDSSAKDKCLLTTWIVEQHRLGNSTPRVDTHVVERIKKAKALSISQRRDGILRWFESHSETLGENFKLLSSTMNNDEEKKRVGELLAWSESIDESELKYLIDFCIEDGLLKSGGNDGRKYSLTPKGYAHLDALRGANPNSEQAFVAMWFDPSMQEAYDQGIDPAIRDAGYRPLRIDQKEHINRIDDEIIAEIRRSRFIVADFTSEADRPRGGVYFEAGFAFGLGIPVIWTCRQDLIGSVHFDTRQFNHIVWSGSEDLRKALTNRIGAVIGDGPLKR